MLLSKLDDKKKLLNASLNQQQIFGNLEIDTKIFSFVSAITRKDKKLLHEAVLKFRPSSYNYEDSWGYIIQSTRYGGFKWVDKANGFLIFFGRKSATDPTLIVTNFFANPEYLIDILKKLKDITEAPQIILKNVNVKEITKWIPYGFRQYLELEKWSSEARFDDQTYPQIIIDLKALATLKGKPYKKLRTALNKKSHVSFRKYHETDKNAVLEVFSLKDGYYKKKLTDEKGEYYVSHAMYPSAYIDKWVITDLTTSQIIGFTATSDISSRNTALVAAIFKPGIKIASIWGIYQTLITKYHEGFEKINLGGYETDGSYNFMRRTFYPSEQLEKRHLVYEP